MASKSTLLGAAGEHYVMCQLLRQGFIAALAPVGVPNADIIVCDEVGDRLCAIQVKTRNDIGRDGGWHMKQKHETIISPTLFYCFLDFGKKMGDYPKAWLIPSQIVADVLRKAHKIWLSTPGNKGQPRKDSEFRRFLPDYTHLNLANEYPLEWMDSYYEAWKLLNLSREK